MGELENKLRVVHLAGKSDVVTWVLERDGQYSSKSLYRFLSFGGVISKRLEGLWRARVPLKVKIFMWQMFHNKLQSADQLKKRNWKGEVNCQLCEGLEDMNHIMFKCKWGNG
jgi:S-adenosylmethionine:diacylglycerol 3-amino-3-carboxypropyl transferase